MIWSEREEVSVRESVCESGRVPVDVGEVGHGCVPAARPNCDSVSEQPSFYFQEHRAESKATVETSESFFLVCSFKTR